MLKPVKTEMGGIKFKKLKWETDENEIGMSKYSVGMSKYGVGACECMEKLNGR